MECHVLFERPLNGNEAREGCQIFLANKCKIYILLLYVWHEYNKTRQAHKKYFLINIFIFSAFIFCLSFFNSTKVRKTDVINFRWDGGKVEFEKVESKKVEKIDECVKKRWELNLFSPFILFRTLSNF